MPLAAFHAQIILPLLAIGAVGGFLSGMLGLGGGIIFVPALYFTLTSLGVDGGHAMRIAIGTSLALVFVTGASSAFWHNKKGSIDFTLIRSWWLFIVLGVAAGTFFASTISGAIIKRLFSVIVFAIAIYMVFGKEPETEKKHKVSLRVQQLVETGIGFTASLIGIGGAILNIPFMTYMGVPMRKAVGTGSALGCIIGLPAIIGYIISGLPHMKELPPYSWGYVNLLALAVIVPLSMVLSPLGVHVSHIIAKSTLRRIFAVVLALVALRMLMA
jgi:uncharacterized membrane protein YfcA